MASFEPKSKFELSNQSLLCSAIAKCLEIYLDNSTADGL